MRPSCGLEKTVTAQVAGIGPPAPQLLWTWELWSADLYIRCCSFRQILGCEGPSFAAVSRLTSARRLRDPRFYVDTFAGSRGSILALKRLQREVFEALVGVRGRLLALEAANRQQGAGSAGLLGGPLGGVGKSEVQVAGLLETTVAALEAQVNAARIKCLTFGLPSKI